MSNQTFANDVKKFDYLKNEWSFVSMLTPVSTGYNTDNFFVTTNMMEDVWCQIGANITKNGITCAEGPDVNYITSKSEKGPGLNIGAGTYEIYFDGFYRIEANVIIKRVVGAGDRNHFIGISLNGADPSACSAIYGTSDNIWNTASTFCSHYFNAGDLISLNYLQNEGADNVYIGINYSINALDS